MPLVSMTGFGGASRPLLGPQQTLQLEVEVRSVNARFLELKIRQPFGPKVEQEIRAVVESRLGRGRVELAVHLRRSCAAAVHSDGPLGRLGVDAQQVEAALQAAAHVQRLALAQELDLRPPNAFELLRFVAGQKQPANEAPPSVPEFLGDLVKEAVEQLHAFRVREGEALTVVLGELANQLELSMAGLERELPAEQQRLQERLQARAEELCAKVGTNAPAADRVAQEVALLVAKGDIAEELARIASHLQQMRETIAAPAAKGQGKTLDFLTQELLREVTTIGSKITSHTGSTQVIAAKATIERVREQVQNVE